MRFWGGVHPALLRTTQGGEGVRAVVIKGGGSWIGQFFWDISFTAGYPFGHW